MNERGLFAVAVCLSIGLGGCCCGLVDWSKLTIDEGGEPSADTPGVDLGLAAYPEATPEERAKHYAWKARLDPPVYRVGYELGADEEHSVREHHHDYAQKLRYKPEGDGIFRWTPPPGCSADMGCILEALAERSKPDIDALVLRFRA